MHGVFHMGQADKLAYVALAEAIDGLFAIAYDIVKKKRLKLKILLMNGFKLV